jgi:hypothetical protein
VNTKEAKDFLVGQAVEQAALDKESLSDIEKRMMYLTLILSNANASISVSNYHMPEYLRPTNHSTFVILVGNSNEQLFADQLNQ